MRAGVRATLAAAATGALLLSGCATDVTSEGDDTSAQEKQELFDEQCAGTSMPDFPDLSPIKGEPGTSTVSTEFGDVELPNDPQRTLGMYTTDVDILIWLGYPLHDTQPIRGDGDYQSFPCFFPFEQLEDVSTFGNYPDYDYESILVAEPDMILNGLGYDKKTVKRLPDAGPTYSVNAFDGVPWVEHFEETATALGREDRFTMWRDYYDQRVAEVKEEIGDLPDDFLVSPIGLWDGKVSASCYSGVECVVFDDLGLDVFEGARAKDNQGLSVSGEQVTQYADIDLAFTITSLGEKGAQEQEEIMDEMKQNELFAELPWVAQDKIATYEMEMTFGSPSGQLAFLEVVADALTDDNLRSGT